MGRAFYLSIGFASLLLGAIGAFVPLLPTVPFIILAAFCFGRSSPALERRLVEHPTFGPHLEAWRERGAISRRGKTAAVIAFAASALLGFLLLDWPRLLIPAAAALIGGAWVLSRPTA
ncbi:MAG: YbaN family protein [Sphingomicrobium sp.]